MIIVFSRFINKELSTCINIKDRTNRQAVNRLLTSLQIKISKLVNKKGLFIFTGITETGDEIFEVIEPQLELETFYYECSKKFNIEIMEKYFRSYNGSIIFINGNECIIYRFDGSSFILHKHLSANIKNRQGRGGSSANRIARLTEISRDEYISRVIDNINTLDTSNNWCFGSSEMLDKLFDNKNCKIELKRGFYCDFDINTIKETKKWIQFMITNEDYDTYYNEVLTFMQTKPDILVFNKLDDIDINRLKYIINNSDMEIKHNNVIKLLQTSKYYEKLKDFKIIGCYYYI